jgi:hypothetical protein
MALDWQEACPLYVWPPFSPDLYCSTLSQLQSRKNALRCGVFISAGGREVVGVNEPLYQF